MRAVVQRVVRARVEVAGREVGAIGPGLAILLGVARDDSEKDAEYLADRCVKMRIFADDAGKMNRSALETGGDFLAISQFTLYGDAAAGRRPSFSAAADGPRAEKLYVHFVECLKRSGRRVATGEFGADMRCEFVNDGPVTLIVESKP